MRLNFDYQFPTGEQLNSHSLCSQTHEHYLPDLTREWNIATMVSMVRRNAAVNADGFGIAWYPSTSPFPDSSVPFYSASEPVIFTSVGPAEHNVNLGRLAAKIASGVIFGHARAASPGSPIHEFNCHPFQFGRYSFMHNGGVANFRILRRPLQNLLSPASWALIKGSTDSELCGALFVDQLPNRDPYEQQSPEVITAALRRTLHLIHDLALQFGDPQQPASLVSSLNFAVTDGVSSACCRFRDSTSEDPPSLYYAQYTHFARVQGETEFYFDPSRPIAGTFVGSEPLSYARVSLPKDHPEAGGDSLAEWKPVPKNHIITILSDNTYSLIPVFDENYLARKVIAKWKAFVRRKEQPEPHAPHFDAVPAMPNLAPLLATAQEKKPEPQDSAAVSLQDLLAVASPDQLKFLLSFLTPTATSSAAGPAPSKPAEMGKQQMID